MGRARDVVETKAMEVPSQRQHQGDFHQLRGLKVEKLQPDPTLRTHAHGARELDRDKQDKGNRIEDVSIAQPNSDVRQRDRQHDKQAHAKPHDLPFRPGREITVAGGIEHRETNRCEAADHQDKKPIQLPESLAERHRGRVQPIAGAHWDFPSRANCPGARRRWASRRISRAIGAAVLDPPPPCSTTTDTA